MRMMEVATKTPNVADVIGSIAWKVQAKGVSIIDLHTFLLDRMLVWFYELVIVC